jgi:hypothetical protein
MAFTSGDLRASTRDSSSNKRKTKFNRYHDISDPKKLYLRPIAPEALLTPRFLTLPGPEQLHFETLSAFMFSGYPVPRHINGCHNPQTLLNELGVFTVQCFLEGAVSVLSTEP